MPKPQIVTKVANNSKVKLAIEIAKIAIPVAAQIAATAIIVNKLNEAD